MIHSRMQKHHLHHEPATKPCWVLLAQSEYGVGLGGVGGDTCWLDSIHFQFSLIFNVLGSFKSWHPYPSGYGSFFGNQGNITCSTWVRSWFGRWGRRCLVIRFISFPLLAHSRCLRGYSKADILSFERMFPFWQWKRIFCSIQVQSWLGRCGRGCLLIRFVSSSSSHPFSRFEGSFESWYP